VNRVGKLALVAGILALALAVPIAAAHLIFLYQAQVTVQPWTPVVWLYGNSDEVQAVNLKLNNKTSPQISLTIPVTNSSYTYVTQALELKVNGVGSPYLSVANCSYTPGPTLTQVELIVYPVGTTPSITSADTINITGFSPCTVSGSVELTAGTTYYVDFLVEPSLPIPYGASSGTLIIYFSLTNQTGTVTVPYPPYP
jgi:hypothetical protein